jgi:hypothetical protein
VRNKADKAGDREIAHIVRAGWFREVNVKSKDSYRMRLLLTQRRNLKRQFFDIGNAVRHSIKTFGLKIGRVSRGEFKGADPRVGSGRSTDRGTDRLHTSDAGRCGNNISGRTSWRSQLSGARSSVGDSCSFPKSAPSVRCRSRHRSMIRVGSRPSNLASTNFERIVSRELFKRGKKLPGVTSPICG